MTTTALKEIDTYGGIDNYLMNLDNNSVSKSKYLSKMRYIISSSLYHKGELSEKLTKKMGYDIEPPAKLILESSLNEGLFDEPEGLPRYNQDG